MNILGVSCYFHDAAAALVRKGQLVAAAEEERFSRVKHDFSFPQRAIDFCLHAGGLHGADLDYVAFFEKPFLKFDRILTSTIAWAPHTGSIFRQAMTAWLLDKLWVKNRLQAALGVSNDRILFVEHHVSHAASAFFCSPFDHAAILTVDGVGEWATATMGEGRDNTLAISAEIRYPHSVGLLYSAFTAFLGFEVNEGEYKVMGMAPYGQPRYVDEVWKLVRRGAGSAFELNLEYFSFHRSTTRTYSDKFEQLFGPPRRPGVPFFTETSGYPSYFGPRPTDFTARARENQHYADVAASIQAVTEELVADMAREACRRASTTRLCMAGGVALNSVANGRLLRDGIVSDLYIQPAAGDSGAALGAALFVWHQLLNHPRGFVMAHGSWGDQADPDEIRNAMAAANLRWNESSSQDDLINRTVDLLLQRKVVGWSQGRFEWGPRALGHRSILADPGRAEMKDIVNTKIKFREPYRPFAPSVAAERAAEWFDLPDAEQRYPARFMLLVCPVRPGAGLPAVTHVDGSARLQTVFRETSPRYHALTSAMGAATGRSVVLNTSFNVRGEPIVNTPEEAISTFLRTEMDALVLDRFVSTKESA